jgi:transcriptional regulator with XRE-family HTH domain
MHQIATEGRIPCVIEVATAVMKVVMLLARALPAPQASPEGPTLPASKSPSARGRQLAAELRRLREASGLTGDEVATRLKWSASKVSRVETGRTAVSAADLRTLLDRYDVTGSKRDRLIELGRTATQRGWWDAFGDILGSGTSTFVALEDDAESERFYAQMIVPGILQTEPYAEEIMRTGLYTAPPGEIVRRVQARLTRQRLLTKKNDPLELNVILDESALRRRVGGPDVMAGELSHLIEIAELPNVTIQVLPFVNGAHIAMDGSFVVLHFPGPVPSYLVYLEHMTSQLVIENEAEAYHYALSFDRLRGEALEPEDSMSLVAQIAREMTN